MGNETKHIIYGLIDPRTLLVRYVGKSSKGLHRPLDHGRPHGLARAGHRSDWIRELRAAGFDYAIVVLCSTSGEHAYCDEQWWIAFGRACGWPLTNHTDGGPGTRGRRASPETLAKMRANCGHPISDAQRRRLRDSLLGNKRTLGFRHSAIARKQMSVARSGKPKSTAHKNAIKNAHHAKRAYSESDLEVVLRAASCLKDIMLALGVSKSQACRLRQLYLGTRLAMR